MLSLEVHAQLFALSLSIFTTNLLLHTHTHTFQICELGNYAIHAALRDLRPPGGHTMLPQSETDPIDLVSDYYAVDHVSGYATSLTRTVICVLCGYPLACSCTCTGPIFDLAWHA